MDTITGRREWLFLGATAVVALHVVDDNFLQPAAGTSALDHLASGLVPLALLALGGWSYLRVRAGARALIAIAIGHLRGHDRRLRSRLLLGRGRARPATTTPDSWRSRRDWSCVGVGVAVLWRSRRRTPRLWWRYSRRLLLALVGVVALYELVLPVGVAYMATHAARAVVPDADLGAPYENVTLTTSDGLTLRGLVRPLEERRRRHLVPRAQGVGDPGADPDAREARLRRAAVRPSRRGRQRG